MKPFLEDQFGNPSSGHWAAGAAKAALETARGQVAALLGCQSDEIVFTSGGSEANNLALKGVFFAHRDKGDHVDSGKWIDSEFCVITFGKSSSIGLATEWLSTVIRRDACRTRSMFPSLTGSAPRYWGD
jgi:Aminotransferase class-V